MTADSLRILHTADLHLGTPFTSLRDDRARRTLREEHPRLLHELVRLTRDHKVDVLLIAGDLFDTPNPDPRLLEQALHSFRRMAPCRVYLVAGNHDPCAPGSFWYTADWPGNVHVFRPGEATRITPDDLPLTIDGYSFGDVYQREPLWSGQDDAGRGDVTETSLAGKSPGNDTPRFKILLTHGDVVSGAGESHYHPIRLNRLPDRYDYLALGHVHLPGSGELTDRRGLWRYPGTPQGRGFDETGVRGYALGTVRRREAGYGPAFEQSWEMLPGGGRPFFILPVSVDGVASIEASVAATEEALRVAMGQDSQGSGGPGGIFPQTETDEATKEEPTDDGQADGEQSAGEPADGETSVSESETPDPDPERQEALKRAIIRLVFRGSPEAPIHFDYLRDLLLERGYFYVETKDETAVAYDEDQLRREAGFHRMLMDVIDQRIADGKMSEAERDAVLPLILRAEKEVRHED